MICGLIALVVDAKPAAPLSNLPLSDGGPPVIPWSNAGGPSERQQLNPDEGLNADLKQVVTCKVPARSKPQLKRAMANHMRRLSNSPARIRSFFRHHTFRYAA